MSRSCPIIGITMGDPCGIGPEIIVKALADESLCCQGRFVIFGFSEMIAYAADLAEVDLRWYRDHYEDFLSSTSSISARSRAWRERQDNDNGSGLGADQVDIDPGITVLDYDELTMPILGEHRPNRYSGEASMAFLEDAIDAAKRGLIDALVTAPISKHAWRLAGYKFPGHTEVLAKRTGTKNYAMMFVAPAMKVILATTHESLAEVPVHLTIGRVFNPIDLADKALREWFGIEHPRIAVCGLNPHAGEDGQFGDEEKRIISPAILMASEAGIDVSGPYPADTLFRQALDGQFDCVVAMYHDQAMIPLKLIAWSEAVNLTVGLPIIRTSPGHGTAFDIAGKNRADASPMKAAIRLAMDLARRRMEKNTKTTDERVKKT